MQLVPTLSEEEFARDHGARDLMGSFHLPTRLIIAFDVRRTHTIRVASFWSILDAVRFQGLGAILDWLTTRLDFMRESVLKV